MNSTELKEKMALLPEVITDKRPPFWDYWRHNLWEYVRDADPMVFQEFPCIYHTMLVNHWSEYVKLEYREIVADEGDMTLRQVATMPARHSTGDLMEGTNLSLNLIHQYYHLWKWQKEMKVGIAEMDRIVEFGGGYGAMALAAYRSGFRGEYIIFDSPEFSLLQEFYLSHVLSDGDFSMVKWNDKRVRMTDLMIACYSLSEVSIEERTKFLNKVKVMGGYLLLFSAQWSGGLDNIGYFRDFAEKSKPARWSIHQHAYLPVGNWYAFGAMK